MQDPALVIPWFRRGTSIPTATRTTLTCPIYVKQVLRFRQQLHVRIMLRLLFHSSPLHRTCVLHSNLQRFLRLHESLSHSAHCSPGAFPLVVSTEGMRFRLVINVFLRIQDNLLCVIRHSGSRTVSIRPNTQLEDWQDKVNAGTKLKRKTVGEL